MRGQADSTPSSFIGWPRVIFILAVFAGGLILAYSIGYADSKRDARAAARADRAGESPNAVVFSDQWSLSLGPSGVISAMPDDDERWSEYDKVSESPRTFATAPSAVDTEPSSIRRASLEVVVMGHVPVESSATAEAGQGTVSKRVRVSVTCSRANETMAPGTFERAVYDWMAAPGNALWVIDRAFQRHGKQITSISVRPVDTVGTRSIWNFDVEFSPLQP